MISNSPQKTIEIAKTIGQRLKQPAVITLEGELGAGKTCFTRGLVMGLGSTELVTSPTFALVNIYNGSEFKIYHFDMYRIKCFFDLESTGFFDFLSQRAILIIEWSSNVLEYLPEQRIDIQIVKLKDEKREIKVYGLNI
ncbi:MAG: tRNA (adenosine(37)-N6)-threonylcarbamoyltransferase complex ATPase subunit type 1 TsaE [Oscillospiraceae bacterium]